MTESEKTRCGGHHYQNAEQAPMTLYTLPLPQKSFAQQLYGWTAWVASVAATSFAITQLGSKFTPSSANTAKSSGTSSLAYNESSNVPESSRLSRRNTCKTGGIENPEEYNTAMHVGALFIILAVSFLGCAFPILASKVPGLRIPGRFFFIVRHFGTGVLIATAFVHLLPTAFQNLSNPCLGKFWTEDYPAMPGAIALAAVFLVAVIEMVFHPSRHIPPASIVSNRGVGCMAAVHLDSSHSEPHQCAVDGTSHPVRDMGPLAGRASSVGKGLSSLTNSPAIPSEAVMAVPSETRNDEKAQPADVSAEQSSTASINLKSEQQMRKDRLQCVLLEMGILFHSVFIGMAISVSVGNEFIILLIAISFHRKHNRPINWTICGSRLTSSRNIRRSCFGIPHCSSAMGERHRPTLAACPCLWLHVSKSFSLCPTPNLTGSFSKNSTWSSNWSCSPQLVQPRLRSWSAHGWYHERHFRWTSYLCILG